MSESHSSESSHEVEHRHPVYESWLERNWFWLVIAFGGTLVAAIDAWHPVH